MYSSFPLSSKISVQCHPVSAVADPGGGGGPIITQLVDLFFDGEPFYFATNLRKVSVVFF